VLAGIAWIALYIALTTAPMFVMAMIPGAPAGRDFWTELSVALGFIGLVQILIQLVLVARYRSITAPYGIDIILYYHRQIAAVALLAVLAHPIILFVRNPRLLALLNPLGTTWAAAAGVIAVAAMILLALLSWFRRSLHLRYEWWRIGHVLLAGVVVVASLIHITGAGRYVNSAAKWW